MTKLVVFTAYPGSAKSTLSRFLQQSLGYANVSGDDVAYEKPSLQGMEIWKEICRRRDIELSKGRDVVIDTTAYNEAKRHLLLDTPHDADRYLIWIRRKPEHLDYTFRARKWPTTADEWARKYGWQDPIQNGCPLLVYDNNSRDDLEKMRMGIMQRLL